MRLKPSLQFALSLITLAAATAAAQRAPRARVILEGGPAVVSGSFSGNSGWSGRLTAQRPLGRSRTSIGIAALRSEFTLDKVDLLPGGERPFDPTSISGLVLPIGYEWAPHPAVALALSAGPGVFRAHAERTAATRTVGGVEATARAFVPAGRSWAVTAGVHAAAMPVESRRARQAVSLVLGIARSF